MKNFIQNGNTLTLPAPYDLVSGQGALVGTIFGVAGVDALTGDDGEFDTTGVYELTKNPTDTPSIGDAAYWDDGNRRVTTTETSNTKIGVFTKAAANGDVVASVRLNGSF